MASSWVARGPPVAVNLSPAKDICDEVVETVDVVGVVSGVVVGTVVSPCVDVSTVETVVVEGSAVVVGSSVVVGSAVVVVASAHTPTVQKKGFCSAHLASLKR